MEEGLRSQCASHQVFSIIQPSVETGKSFQTVWITHSIQKNQGIMVLSFLWLTIFHSLLHHSVLIHFCILVCFESCCKLVKKRIKVILWKGEEGSIWNYSTTWQQIFSSEYCQRCQSNVDMMPLKKGAP